MFDRNKYMKEYYKNNKERYKKTIKKYQQSEKGQKKVKEYRKKYYNRDDIKKRRSEQDKKRYTPENKLYRTINKTIKLHVKNLSKNGKYYIRDITKLKYNILYGIDLDKIIEKLKPIPKDIENYELDHIIPITKFNLLIKEDIKKAYNPNNLQLLIKKDNKKKSNHI